MEIAEGNFRETHKAVELPLLRQVRAFNVSILDSANRAVGALRLNLEDGNEAPIGEECEFVAISTGTARIGEGPHDYIVMAEGRVGVEGVA